MAKHPFDQQQEELPTTFRLNFQEWLEYDWPEFSDRGRTTALLRPEVVKCCAYVERTESDALVGHLIENRTADYADSDEGPGRRERTSTDSFGTKASSKPNGGTFPERKWQNTILVFTGDGVLADMYWCVRAAAAAARRRRGGCRDPLALCSPARMHPVSRQERQETKQAGAGHLPHVSDDAECGSQLQRADCDARQPGTTGDAGRAPVWSDQHDEPRLRRQQVSGEHGVQHVHL